MRRLSIGIVLALSIGMLAGCISRTQVSFAPEKGEARTYRLYSRAEFQMRGATTPKDVVVESNGLVRYRAGGTDRPMTVTPRNICVTGQRRSRYYCSSWAGERSPEVRAMLAAGFEIPGGADTQRWPQSPDADAVYALRDRDEDLARLLPRQFVAPGLFAGIDATPGTTTDMANLPGLPPAKLTVMATTPDRVFLSLAPTVEGDHLAGHLVIDRHSGWIERMAAVYESSVSMGGQQEPVRQLIALAPTNWSEQSLRNDYGETPQRRSVLPDIDIYFALHTTPSAGRSLYTIEEANTTPLDEHDLFATTVGGFRADTALGVELEYGQPLWRSEYDRLGRLEFSDLVPFDDQDEPIDLIIAGSHAKTAPYTFTGNLLTTDRLLPLGLEHTAERLERIATIRGHAAYYAPRPVETLSLKVPKTGSETSVQGADGVQARLSSQGGGHYLLSFSGPGYYATEIGLDDYARTPPVQPDDDFWPDWVRIGERKLFTTILGNGSARVMPLQIDKNKDALAVLLHTFEPEPTFEKDLRFIPRKTRFNALDLPPNLRIPLHLTPAENKYQPHAAADADLEPLSMDSGAPVFALTAEQSVLCERSATRADGEPVAADWRLLGQDYPHESGAKRQLPETLIWRLIADDNGPANAQGEIEFGLTCREGHWQRTDYDLGERPWLIDLVELTGKQPDPTSPVALLLGRYRFLDANGEALSVLPVTFDGYWDHKLANAALAPFLAEGRYLRIAGQVAAVETVKPGDITIDRRWTLPAAKTAQRAR